MSSPPKNSIRLHNLPAPLSVFIGRKQELAEVRRLLSAHRLLTLTGPGGCGKTRLALQVAGELGGGYKDGIWLTELASLARQDLVSQALASTLDVRERAGVPMIDALVSHLQAYHALFVLDNCEHLVGACAQLVASLLESCPNVRWLATSREPLGVSGEVVWSVPPLSLPDLQPWRNPSSEEEALKTYQHSEAIQLFVARATEASPPFILTGKNGPWVAEICRRLDGIPLAIELAAARLRAFSVRQIAGRLDDRFQLLTSRLRTTPPRHQTLEATLDWSYDLLPEIEQTVLQRLSVFSSGWTLEAAEVVNSDNLLSRSEVIEALANLVDKSLVVVDRTPDGRRYRLLETIRQYARQKLANTGKADLPKDKHLNYYVAWAERGASRLNGLEQSTWLEHFAAEHNNIRAALEWSQKSPLRVERGLRLAVACGQYWRLHGYLSEGRRHLVYFLSLPEARDRNTTRAWALLWAAHLAYVQTDYAATSTMAEESLGISLELGEEGKPAVADAYELLGEYATEVGDYKTAPGLFEAALKIYQELQHRQGVAGTMMQLGWAAMRVGEYDRAGSYLKECLPLFEEMHEFAMLGFVLSGLGELAIRQGKLTQARELLEESLKIRNDLGERWGIAIALGSLGWVALVQRDFMEMRSYLMESLAIRIELGDRGGIAWCLEKLAEAASLEAQALPGHHRRRDRRRAVQIFGAAAALRAPLNSVIDPADQPGYDRTLKSLRQTLGEEAFEASWKEGAASPLQAIVDLALKPALEAAEERLLSRADAEKIKFGGLSPREREAAMLIARGHSNREIAELMVVRVKTVETYVTRILNKLGFDSRVQIATWAVESRLAEFDPGDP